MTPIDKTLEHLNSIDLPDLPVQPPRDGQVMTGACILSYPSLTEPRAPVPGQPPKYSCGLLIPHEAAWLPAIMEAIRGLCVGMREPRLPIRRYTLGERDGYAEVPGWLQVRASTGDRFPPRLLGADGRDLSTADAARLLVGGCVVRAALRLRAYDTAGNKGVAAYLQAVQWVAEGRAFGAAPVTFDAIGSAAPSGIDSFAEPVAPADPFAGLAPARPF